MPTASNSKDISSPQH